MKTISNETGLTLNQSKTGRLLRVALPGALAGGILLIVYFLGVRAIGYHENTYLRWLNFVLIIPVSLFTINRYLKSGTGKTYLEALASSIFACLGSYSFLSLFTFVYLHIDVAFMEMLYQKAFPELDLSPLSIVILLVFEGAVGSTIISFVLMQFYKDQMRNAA